MELPSPLHVGPHAADEVGGGAVAQDVVFRGPGGQVCLEDFQQGGGEGGGFLVGVRGGPGQVLGGVQGMGFQEFVHDGVDFLEVELRQTALKGPGFVLGQGLQAAVGLEHLLKLAALQEAGAGRPGGLGKGLVHGGLLSSGHDKSG